MKRSTVVTFAFCILMILLITPLKTSAQQTEKPGKGSRIDLESYRPWAGISFGLGTQYGGAGINAEFQPVRLISITGGFGGTEGVGMGIGGIRVYIPTKNDKVMFRISGLGGHVAVIKYGYTDSKKAQSGWAAGIEVTTFMNEQSYFTLGAYYVNGGTYSEFGGGTHSIEEVTVTVGVGIRGVLPEAKPKEPVRISFN